MRGLDVAVDDAVAVVDDLEHRSDAVRGAGCGRQDLVRVLDVAVVDAVDDVLQVALARSGEQDAGDALGLEVLLEPLAVAPHTRVIDEDGVVDAVLGVVDGCWVVGVDHLDLRAVGPDDLVLLVDGDRAVERTVDGVAAQEGGALDDVAVALLTDHDAAQTHAVVSGLASDEDAGEQAADAAEAVEHDIDRLLLGVLANDVGEGGLDESTQVGLAGIGEVERELAQIDRHGGQVQVDEDLENGEGLRGGEFLAGDAAGVAVCLDDVDVSDTLEQRAEDRRHDVGAAQRVQQRDHLLSALDALVPVVVANLGVSGHFNQSFTHGVVT